ncbi:Alpha/Beta hydrolase protein [Phascolomyces articulosus]|uniref:Alpha/Beta hydrolase protein n=1 Tax=Phascolomyces articulosus TaxID=60185 RepID=A0AAD5JR83_9FUNG|nr:Alpha/Beta hydrolase protein [Phascolomyces articulosus]
MAPPSTLVEKGHVDVAKNGRESKPVNIYYEKHGYGPEKVLLVMGLSTPCSAWDFQVDYLARSGKYTVVIFDNRGMGHSDSPLGIYSTSQMAKDALILLDHLGWTKNVHINGVSMGGMISLEMVDAAPDRFSSLTLTSTTAKRNIPTWAAISALSKIALFYNDPRDKLITAMELVYPQKWLSQKPENPSKAAEYDTNLEMASANFISHVRRSRLQPLHGNLAQAVACLTHSVSDQRLLKIKSSGLPVLVITGTWDNLVRPQYSFHLKKVLDPRFELFEGSGHAIPEEQPDRYNALIDDHFSCATGSVATTSSSAKL